MALRSPSVAKQSHGEDKGKEAQKSARRLAASLWEINGLQSPGDGEEEMETCERNKIGKLYGTDLGNTLLLEKSHKPDRKEKDGSKLAGNRKRSSATSQKLQLLHNVGEWMDSVPNGASIKVASHSAVDTTGPIKTRLKDLSGSLIASKELVKVLFRMWSQGERNSSGLTLVSALRVEIDLARHQVEQLVHEKRYSNKEIDVLLERFASEKAAWKRKEQYRIFSAVSSVARELEVEKKMRRQTERVNRRLGRELADTRAHLSKAVKELGCERRAREILEQTCDKLARGIGEDRSQELKRERQMLQLTDVLCEERVQMKLAEARYEYEEKNAALERLRSELEVFLGGQASNRDGGDNGDNPSNIDRNSEFADFLEQFSSCQNGEMEQHSDDEVEEDEEEDPGDSELHSIELNMDNHSKNYKWSFDNEGRAPADEIFKGRSLPEKIHWESICLQRKTSDGIEWDLINSNNYIKANAGGFDKGRLSETSFQGERNGNRSIKDLKDNIQLQSPGGCQGLASSRPQSPPEAGSSERFSISSGDQFDENGGGGNKS